VREVRAAGTSLVGDVTNTLAAYDLLADSALGGAVFREVLGFSAPDPAQVVADAEAQIESLMTLEWLRPSVVPHAPYSVSLALLRAIAAAAGARAISVHLGESEDEMRFLRDGTGAWRDLLARLGVWTDAWQPPRCGPVEYLDRAGLLTPRLLAVHGTQLDTPEIARLAEAGATIVTCPRSNQWTGAGTPPVEKFYATGVRVAIGTDSLASVEDLNVFGELAALRRLAPGVPAHRLLESATIQGAAALGFDADFGTIAPGKRADLIAVRVPSGVEDVEEYLLSGIEPDAIRWLQ
jgi:aminodeoxyfutalosine deaminase